MQREIPEKMKVITSSMAARILNLNEAKLRQMLYGFEMTSEEMNAVAERLSVLQEKIIKDNRTYKKLQAKGVLLPGTIKIVEDEELDLLRIKEDLSATITEEDKDGNLFNRVYDNTCRGNYNILVAERQLTNRYRKGVYQLTFGDDPEMYKIAQDMENDKVWHQRKTNLYNVMADGMKRLQALMADFSGPATPVKDHSEELRRIANELSRVLNTVNEYISYKDHKTSGEEWRSSGNLDDPNRVRSITERRYRHALAAKELLAKKLMEFNDLDQPLREYLDFAPQKERLLMRQSRIQKGDPRKKDAEERAEELQRLRREAHFNVSRKNLLDSINRNRTEKNPAKKKQNEHNNIITYGFVVNSLDPEYRELLKKDVKEAAGIEPEPDETALRRSVAMVLVICGEDEYTDLRKTAESLMKKKYFNEFFNRNREELIPEDAFEHPGIRIPTTAQMKGFLGKLQAVKTELEKAGQQKKMNGPRP